MQYIPEPAAFTLGEELGRARAWKQPGLELELGFRRNRARPDTGNSRLEKQPRTELHPDGEELFRAGTRLPENRARAGL
jgi:hypothetical protein